MSTKKTTEAQGVIRKSSYNKHGLSRHKPQPRRQNAHQTCPSAHAFTPWCIVPQALGRCAKSINLDFDEAVRRTLAGESPGANPPPAGTGSGNTSSTGGGAGPVAGGAATRRTSGISEAKSEAKGDGGGGGGGNSRRGSDNGGRAGNGGERDGRDAGRRGSGDGARGAEGRRGSDDTGPVGGGGDEKVNYLLSMGVEREYSSFLQV